MKRFSKIVYAVLVLSCLLNCARLYTMGQQVEALINLVLAHMFLTLDLLLSQFALLKSDVGGNNLTLHLKLSQKIVNRLHDVRHMLGSDDLVIVCREALSVYDTLVSAVTKDKARIFVETPDGKREEFVILSPKSDEPTNLDELAKSDFGVSEDTAKDLGTKTQIR